MRKSKSPAEERTVGLFTKKTNQELAQEAQVIDLEERAKSLKTKPKSRSDWSKSARELAKKPPSWAPEGLQLLPTPNKKHMLLVAVGEERNGSSSSYAAVFLSDRQLDKLEKLLHERRLAASFGEWT